MRGHLLLAAREQDAMVAGRDEYGERYLIDFELVHGGKAARIRSAWIVLRGERLPRLTSCYVLLD